MKSYVVPILAVVAATSLATNALMYARWSTSRPLVTVGSAVITKKQFQDQLEYNSGQAVLSKLVFDSLVTQAAARSGVTPTTQDVDDRIAMIQRRSPQALTQYSADPAKMAEFRRDLATSIALENLRIKDVALSPAQVSAFYTQHQAALALPQQISTTTVMTQNPVDAATAADLLRQNDPPDVIARQPRLHVIGLSGYNPNLQALPASLTHQISAYVQSAKAADVKTFRSGGFFLTFRVNSNSRAAVPPLAQIRGQVERLARLERAPSQSEELARLYHAANPTFNTDKYTSYFTAVQQYPVSADNGKKTASAR